MLSTARLLRWPVWATVWRYIAYPFTHFLDFCRPLLGVIAKQPSPGDVEQLGGTEEESQKACPKPIVIPFTSNNCLYSVLLLLVRRKPASLPDQNS
jgi:hypothetical protein